MGRTAVPEGPGPHGGIQHGSAGLPAAARTFAQGERNPLLYRRAGKCAGQKTLPAKMPNQPLTGRKLAKKRQKHGL